MRKITLAIIGLLGVLCICLLIVLMSVYLINKRGRSFQIVNNDFPLKQKWCFETDRSIRSTPVESNSSIAVRTNKDLYVVNASTGEMIWSKKLPASRIQYVAPPVFGNNILIVTHSKGVTAFDLKTGEQLWYHQDTSEEPVTFAIGVKDQVAVTMKDVITGLDIETGNVLWEIKRLNDRPRTAGIIDEDYLYMIFHNQIRVYDVFTGEQLWKQDTEPWSLGSWAVGFNDGVFYIRRSDGGISAIDIESKETLWKREDLNISNYPMTTHKDTLLIGLRRGIPIALNALTGETIWIADELEQDTYQTPLVMDDTVYIRSLFNKKLYALNLEDGSIIGYLETGRPTSVSSNFDFSLGPVQVNSDIVFATDNKLCSYGK